jgi:SAM-dependent methyltransferase
MGGGYRQMMARLFSYQYSDFDLRNHRADLRIDLQDIQLADSSFDIILTPHVLEHVPETDRALSELWRILAPGGRMLLQVPLLQGRTSRPTSPEFHGDDTLVHWRFGWDLTERCRTAGFTTRVLVTAEFGDLLAADSEVVIDCAPEFDLASTRAGVELDDLECVVGSQIAAQLGIQPGYQFAVWDCMKPT